MDKQPRTGKRTGEPNKAEKNGLKACHMEKTNGPVTRSNNGLKGLIINLNNVVILYTYAPLSF